ncbi:MAG: hypothetical protein EZS28_012533 [Streblomastix strix]|uniref:Uncharacterized protein n=1 Tax=Streblomastix strix TaxID=222440 RepID=A0A5J4WAY4_9EUKA|nr:MAG: hypothetical protein EZS28_012533 [Streblomastix strix]
MDTVKTQDSYRLIFLPDQLTPASYALPLTDGTATAGTANEYSRGNHQHPLNITSETSKGDINLGATGISTNYARSDHYYELNADPTSQNKPVKDAREDNKGNYAYYAKSDHAHQLNVDQPITNVPLVNTTAAANGTSDNYCRNDYVHPQSLINTGSLTSTMYIQNGAQATDILLANGDSKPIFDEVGDGFVAVTDKTLQIVQGYFHYGEQLDNDDDESASSQDSHDDDYISKANQGLIISADGTTLSFNGCVIAVTGATNGAALIFDTGGETVTELAVHQYVNEYDAIIAYSLAYIEVSHSFYESLHIAIQLNGPQKVEKPNKIFNVFIQKQSYLVTSAPDSIVQIYAHEQVAVPLAASGALVQCAPSFVSQITGGINKAAGWIAPTLNKVLGTVAGPVSMIHLGVGAAMGKGQRIAGGVDRYVIGPK